MSNAAQWVTRAVTAGLVTHVVLTAFENTPDAKVSFGTRDEWLARLPQWRFFAPTPGVDNTHLMFRSRTHPDDDWSQWEELPMHTGTPLTALVWNPGTRAPKALFDCTQHLRMMGGQGLSWPTVTDAPAYRTVEHAVRVASRQRGAADAQFMLVASRIGDEESVMQPLLVSDPIALGA